MILEAALDAESRGSKFEEEKDIHIVPKCPPTNYLLIAKEKTSILQERELPGSRENLLTQS